MSSTLQSIVNKKEMPLPPDSRHIWKNRNSSTITQSQQHVWRESEENKLSFSDKLCRLCIKLPMLHPFGAFRCSWDVAVMLMLIYTSLEVPFTLGFGITLELIGEYSQFGVIALIIDICLLFDIILNFRTAYFDKYDDLRLMTNPKKIAKKYIRGWFIMDLVTSFPFEFILPDNHHNEDKFATYLKVLRIFRLFRIFKILRLLKMVKIFDGFMSHVVAREILMALKLFKVLCLSLLTAHICACLWYYVGCKSHSVYNVSWILDVTNKNALQVDITCEEDKDLFYKYSYSSYWSVVTLFTTGYGDIIPTNPYEQWTASLVILIGTCLFGYFVGTITSLITEGDRISSSIVNKLEDAQHFCQQKRLPPEMSRAVLTHTRYHCNNNYVLGDENDVLSNLPSYLAMDVSLYISNKYLENLDFFGNKYLDPYVRGLIALKMKSISCNKGYKLFVKGDIAEKIYIQRIGKASHKMYDKNNRKYEQVIQRGDVVGEYAFILKKRNSTLTCETWCEFYVFDVNDITQILQQHYTNNWSKKLNKIKQFIKIEYSKSVNRRKKRQCLLKHEALLPTIYNNTEHEIAPNEGERGHCDWGNDNNDLNNLNILTNKVMQGNDHKNDIKFSLNELSRNANQIIQLTKNSKQNSFYLKNKIKNSSLNINNSTNAKLSTSRSIKNMLHVGREDSLIRHLEVTRKYKRHRTNDSSSDDDIKDMEQAQDIKDVEHNVNMLQLNVNDTENEHPSNAKQDVADYVVEMLKYSEMKKSVSDIIGDDNNNVNNNQQSNGRDSMSGKSVIIEEVSRNTDTFSDDNYYPMDENVNKYGLTHKQKQNNVMNRKKKRNKIHKTYS